MPRPTSYRRLALLNLLLASQGKRILSTIEKSTKDSRRKSEAFLLSWIRKNEKTEFGREHHFSDIRSVSDYQRLVPLSEYSDYLPSLSRMEKGEKDLLFRGKPSYYNETSGTTGKSKRIPVSPLQEKAIARKGNPQLIPALEKKNGCFDLRHRRILALMANTDLSYTEDGTPVGDVVSMMLKDVSGLMNLFFTTPLVSLASPEVHDRMYVHLLFGLQDKDVYLLMSAYQSEIVGMVDYLFRNEALLLHDIREGRISSEVKISSSLKEELEWRLRPNPERAEELRTILSDPDREGILVRIWPYLKTVSGVGSETGNLAPYTSLLRHYLGKEGHLYFGAYSASEGLMAISPDYDEASYLPLIDTSFLEFLPLEIGRAHV